MTPPRTVIDKIWDDHVVVGPSVGHGGPRRSSALLHIDRIFLHERTGPWLPWMKMGVRPGNLIYSGHGRKFMKFDDLPADVRDFTKANYPLYMTSPATYVTPNETSWTYYKKQFPPAKK